MSSRVESREAICSWVEIQGLGYDGGKMLPGRERQIPMVQSVQQTTEIRLLQHIDKVADAPVSA